jgi:Holliday junction resolvase RusA-like endonuclease
MAGLAFVVYGIPQPKGSAKAFLPKGWTRPIVTSDNPKNKGWQQLVAESATRAIGNCRPPFEQFAGPVTLAVTFYLPRPKSLKQKTAPHTTRPDADKLLRSVKDALSGVLWRDDSQVDTVTVRKLYAEPGAVPRAEIFATETVYRAAQSA